MNTYRVSNVEAFRQWETDAEADTDALVLSIMGLGESSPAMLAGTAFHAALEHATQGLECDALRWDGYTFHFDMIDAEISLPEVRELRASHTWIVDGEPIRISGQVDALEGLTVYDHKTTGRFDPDRYLTGYQWRLYLLIFGASRFVWNVFEIAEADSIDPRAYDVRAVHRLEQHAYPQMAQDCADLVTRFARFVRANVEGKPAPVQRVAETAQAVPDLTPTF